MIGIKKQTETYKAQAKRLRYIATVIGYVNQKPNATRLIVAQKIL